MKQFTILLAAAILSCFVMSCGNTGGETATAKTDSSVSTKTELSSKAKKAVDQRKTDLKSQQNKNTKSKAAAEGGGNVDWVSVTDLEAKMKEEPRPVMVDLYTDWCGWCKKMDKATFQHPKIAEYMNKNFYAVKFDAETKDNLKFKGADYKFVPAGRKGYNELAHKWGNRNGRMGYPTIAFLDKNLDRIEAISGFKQAADFDALLKFFGEDHYKDQKFNEFAANYTSEIPKQAPPTNRRRTNAGNKNIKVQQNGQKIDVQKLLEQQRAKGGS